MSYGNGIHAAMKNETYLIHQSCARFDTPHDKAIFEPGPAGVIAMIVLVLAIKNDRQSARRRRFQRVLAKYRRFQSGGKRIQYRTIEFTRLQGTERAVGIANASQIDIVGREKSP